MESRVRRYFYKFFLRGGRRADKVLRCYNPQCEDPVIREGPVSYCSKYGIVTHPSQCRILWGSHQVMKTGRATQFDYADISLDDARELLRAGKLAKRPTLDDSVSHARIA